MPAPLSPRVTTPIASDGPVPLPGLCPAGSSILEVSACSATPSLTASLVFREQASQHFPKMLARPSPMCFWSKRCLLENKIKGGFLCNRLTSEFYGELLAFRWWPPLSPGFCHQPEKRAAFSCLGRTLDPHLREGPGVPPM